MAALSRFISDHTEEILTEWETFARSLPIGASMDVVALRDHAKGMLDVIARDLEETQTSRQQDAKAKGASDAERLNARSGDEPTNSACITKACDCSRSWAIVPAMKPGSPPTCNSTAADNSLVVRRMSRALEL